MKIAAGGIAELWESAAKPATPEPVRAISPQPSPQGRLENTGAAGGFAAFPWQQHLPRPRQQPCADSLGVSAETGASDV